MGLVTGIKESLKSVCEVKDPDILKKMRQELTTAASRIANATISVKDRKMKAAMKKAEELVDKARRLLFDAEASF